MKTVADSMRETAGKLTAWADAIRNLNRDVGDLLAGPMQRESARLTREADALHQTADQQKPPPSGKERAVEIKGKMSADVTAIGVKRNQAQDGRTAYCDLEIMVTQEDAESRFGPEFAKLAFSTLEVREDPTGAKCFSFLQDTIKPNDRLVLSRHRIEIADAVLGEQPELRAIKTCDGSPRVVAEIRIPVPTTHKALMALAKCVGATIDVKFAVESPKLGFEVVDGGEKKRGKSSGEAAI